MTIAIIISLVSLAVALFTIKHLFSFQADTLVSDCDNLDIYEDLEKRIESLESGVKAHVENIRILSSQITELQVETKNIGTLLNNLTPFIDKTRGMAEGNTKRLDSIQRGRED